MNVKDFKEIIEKNPDKEISWVLPDNSSIPRHYHITEVGKSQKELIDCVGSCRTIKSCFFQVWLANDTKHRLKTSKLKMILDIAKNKNLIEEDFDVEIEYEQEVVSQYPIAKFEIKQEEILFYLGKKHTACSDPVKCGCL